MILNNDFIQLAYWHIQSMRLTSKEGIFMMNYVNMVERGLTHKEQLEQFLPFELYNPLHIQFDELSIGLPSLDTKEKFFNLFYYNKGLKAL